MSPTAAKYMSYSLADFEATGTTKAIDADYLAGRITAAEYKQILSYRQQLFSQEWNRRKAAGQKPKTIIEDLSGIKLQVPNFPQTVVESVFGNPADYLVGSGVTPEEAHQHAVDNMNRISPPDTIVPKLADAADKGINAIGNVIKNPLKNIGLIFLGVVGLVLIMAIKR